MPERLRPKAAAKPSGAGLDSAPADPTQWADESKRSVAFACRRVYTDAPYACVHCGAACVFSARDQKYSFEMRKASIWQRRTLCRGCWLASHRIRAALRACEEAWLANKAQRGTDAVFLARWLELLLALDKYGVGGRDVARTNMLRKLLAARE